MNFALATDEQTLFVFATVEKAIAYCEGIDVEEGIWLFWGADGLPLHPDLSRLMCAGVFRSPAAFIDYCQHRQTDH